MNSISVSGILGRDAELRALPDGTPVLSFSVADSQGREKLTIWWSCSLFGKRAQSMQPYLSKGQHVTVVGNVTEREWKTQEGEIKKKTDIRVFDIALQGGQRQQNTAPAPSPAKSQIGTGFEDMDDDIPF